LQGLGGLRGVARCGSSYPRALRLFVCTAAAASDCGSDRELVRRPADRLIGTSVATLSHFRLACFAGITPGSAVKSAAGTPKRGRRDLKAQAVSWFSA